MPLNRFAVVLYALIGGGVGLLVAYSIGVTSWLDAKLYLAGGVVCGVGIGTLIERFSK